MDHLNQNLQTETDRNKRERERRKQAKRLKMMMMTMEDDESQHRNNLSLDDIDLSLLRLNSPPEISPLKRSSPVSDESDHPKRRKLSPRNPILITSPLLFTHPETQIDDPTQYQILAATTPSASKTPDIEKQQSEEEEEEEDCGEGMRIERSGEGFVIRLKCRCRQAFRVLFSDHHLYFKPL